MSFLAIQYASDTVLVEYTGLVGYRERAMAVARAVERLERSGAHLLLVDFTRAVLAEEGAAERADYIARAIVALNAGVARVALVAVPHAHAWPAELACEVHHVPTNEFPDRASAMQWLRNAETDPLPLVARPPGSPSSRLQPAD